MADTQEEFASYTVTLKGGGGFQDPWLVVRANDEQDLGDKLEALEQGDTLKVIRTLGATFGNIEVEGVKASKPARRSRDEEDDEEEERPTRRGSTGRSSSRGGSRTPSRSRDEQTEEHPEGVECTKRGCGEVLVYKSGISRAGNKYALWACPNGRAKDDGHSSEYVN